MLENGKGLPVTAQPTHLITDPDDPCIAAYRDVRERDLVGRDGCFIAEGEVVLRVLLQHRRFAVESLLIAEQRATALAPLLALVPKEVPVYLAPSAVMDAIVGFHIHRGILAVGRIGTLPRAQDILSAAPTRACVVGLVGIANHDNMGGIFRNAAAFGAAAVLLDETCCDPLYRKAIRVSVGGCLKVPFARAGSAADMISLITQQGFTPYALSPAGEIDLTELEVPKRPALLLGAEGPGLPDDVLQAIKTVRIGMACDFDSLNVATTSGISLHTLTAQAFRKI